MARMWAYGNEGGNGGGQPQMPAVREQPVAREQPSVIPTLPAVMVKVDQLASRVPWWVWFLAGGIAVYWIQKRGSIRKLIGDLAAKKA